MEPGKEYYIDISEADINKGDGTAENPFTIMPTPVNQDCSK